MILHFAFELSILPQSPDRLTHLPHPSTGCSMQQLELTRRFDFRISGPLAKAYDSDCWREVAARSAILPLLPLWRSGCRGLWVRFISTACNSTRT